MPKHIFKTSLRNAAAGVAGILAVASAGAAQAATVNKIGWVWGNQPTATSAYTPPANFSYNSAGGTITITRSSPGFYEVDFGKLYAGTPGGNVQVTAYNSSGYCITNGWSFNPKGNIILALVSCYDGNGNPADSMFTLLYQWRSGNFGNAGRGLAYLTADQPSAASYTPASTYQYNSTGAANTMVRNSVGNYTATLPGLTKAGGSVQVTTYKGTETSRCKVSHWNHSSSGTLVYVLCFNSAGQAADEFFNLAYSEKESFGHTLSATARGVYVWTNKSHDTSTYTPATSYQYNGFGTGFLTSVKVARGQYTVSIPGSLAFNKSNVLVTGYDTTSDYCNVVGWGTNAASVACFAQGGVPIDSNFDMAFQTAD